MFSDMIRYLKCDSCENGRLMYSQRLTMEAWQQPEVFRLDDLDKLKDNIISDILIMACTDCNTQVRFTLKEIEKEFRKNLSNRLFTMIGKGDIPDPENRLRGEGILRGSYGPVSDRFWPVQDSL